MKRFLSVILLFGIALSTSAKGSRTLSYGTPESVGMNGAYLTYTIDSIANRAIAERCFPGCQILVARHGKIVHHKSYGYHTYDCKQPVRNSHLYDIASCTKVMAATLCLMRLVEQGKISLDAPLSDHFEEFRGSDKEGTTLREFLTHQGGLTAVSLSKLFFDEEKKLNTEIFSPSMSKEFPYKVCDSLYACKDIHARWFKAIADSRLYKKRLLYSCLSFHCYPTLVKRITGRDYEEYLYEEFYTPLDISKGAMYNPTRRYPLSKIVPTEFDNYFRKRLVHGYVHDESAASLGGVSGNAGLFANAESLAVILQMLLNGGEYDGVRYFDSKTVREWTMCQYPENDNYRGIGFDARRFNDRIIFAKRGYYYARSASMASYGHSGFTGTMVWVDPAEDLIFVFLSNRVYPSRKSGSFFKLNPRANCHEAAYEAIRRYIGR
ncbi:MAG: serine hydrolase [Alistipes sp.]|nr:serine hydrolase [Alistipes sp.]